MTQAAADPILAPIASLALPDAGAMTSRAETALAFIREFRIDTAEDYGLAADELRAIKARSAAIEAQRTGITKPLNEVLRRINDLFRGPGELLAEGERVLKAKMLAYDQEQKRIADEQRRAAEAVAAAERARLAAEAAERQRVAEAQAAAAAAAKAAGDAQAAEVAQAAAERAQAEATVAATTAQLVVAAPAAVEPPRVKGVSTTTTITFKVTDLHKLVCHIAEHPELLALVCADEVKLRAYVRGLGTACVLPGVAVSETQTMRARAA
jgi:hypothetical protein